MCQDDFDNGLNYIAACLRQSVLSLVRAFFLAKMGSHCGDTLQSESILKDETIEYE